MAAFLLRFVMVVFCVLGVHAGPALAYEETEQEVQAPVSMRNYTSAEKVGFAFYQITRLSLPYNDWIFTSEKYLSADPGRKQIVRDEERKRLEAGFQAFDRSRDAIRVQTKAKIKIMDNPDYKKGNRQAINLGHTKLLQISFEQRSPGSLYFPYQVGKLWMAVLPGELDKKVTYGISATQATKLATRLNASDFGEAYNVAVDLTVIAHHADSVNPMVVKETPLWLVLTDVGALTLRDQTGASVWTEAADWYASEARTQLLKLQR